MTQLTHFLFLLTQIEFLCDLFKWAVVESRFLLPFLVVEQSTKHSVQVVTDNYSTYQLLHVQQLAHSTHGREKHMQAELSGFSTFSVNAPIQPMDASWPILRNKFHKKIRPRMTARTSFVISFCFCGVDTVVFASCDYAHVVCLVSSSFRKKCIYTSTLTRKETCHR